MNHQWVERKIKKYLEINKNRNTTHQNLQDAVRAVIRGKLRVINDTL